MKEPIAHSHRTTRRVGGWLPHSHVSLAAWIKETIAAAEAEARTRFSPVIEEFRLLIESDPVLYMYFTQMFQEQPSFRPPTGSGDIKLRDYQQMLLVLDHLLTTAPSFETTSMVGCPINAILDFPMCTPAGLAAFALPPVNEMLGKVLSAWGAFLDSKESAYVLNDSPTGWLCPAAAEAMNLEEYQADPALPHWGFKSWNDFFTCRFKPGRRPVALAEDRKAITSPCEATPFALKTHVKERDTFWLKSQPYSLRHLLHGHYVDRFLGGTVYQAFLSAENYHRWHSPVTGTVKRIEKVPGSYYSEAASEGFDPVGPNNSQGYIAHVATRALLFLEAENADIGLICLVFVGMGEVSSCIFADSEGRPLKEGQKLLKGDQLGYFQFGGSTYCLVLRGGRRAVCHRRDPPGGKRTALALVKVNSLLAMAN